MTAVQILCSECQYENEAERVYCHHCGGRLDRTAKVPKKEAPVETQKRVRKMFDPTRAKLRLWFTTVLKFIAGSAVAAVIVTMILPPEVPEPKKTLVLASEVRLNMESALQKHQPPQLDFSEEQVNAYLTSALKTKKGALDKPFLSFQRAIASFAPGVGTLTIERSFFGYSLFTAFGFSVDARDGRLVMTKKRAYIGRMPIDPRLANYMDILFADVFGVLDRDAKLAAKFGGVSFSDQHVALAVPAN